MTTEQQPPDLLAPLPLDKSVVLVLDRTASMGDMLYVMSRLFARYVIKRVVDGWEPETLGLVTIDDHYLSERYERYIEGIAPMSPGKRGVISNQAVEVYGLTENLEEYTYWLRGIERGYGDDSAECYACAIAAARRLKPDARIWLICDAYPHGTRGFVYEGGDEQLAREFGESDDYFEQGCPLGEALDLTNVSVLLPDFDVRGWHDEGFGPDNEDFLQATWKALRRAVPSEGFGVLTYDPQLLRRTAIELQEQELERERRWEVDGQEAALSGRIQEVRR